MYQITNEANGQPTIRVSGLELVSAAHVGFLRNVSNIDRGRRDNHGLGAEGIDGSGGWGIHIEGAIGEAIVAWYMDRFWSVGKIKGSDVGEYQVRTRSKPRYSLIVHPDDPDDVPFILVTGLAPVMTIRGYMFGVDAKNESYWWTPPNTNRPAYFVPQEKLHPIANLRDEAFEAGYLAP